MGRQRHGTSIVHDRERGLVTTGACATAFPDSLAAMGNTARSLPEIAATSRSPIAQRSRAPAARPHLLGGLPGVVQDERVGRCHQAAPLGPGPDASRATRAPLVNMSHLSTRDSPERACGDPPLSGARYLARTGTARRVKRYSRSPDIGLASTSAQHQPNTNPTPTQHQPHIRPDPQAST
jgi:hypothetical protein